MGYDTGTESHRAQEYLKMADEWMRKEAGGGFVPGSQGGVMDGNVNL